MSEKIVKLETGYAPVTKALNVRARLLRAQSIASYNLDPSPERDAVVSDIMEALRELDGGDSINVSNSPSQRYSKVA